MGVGESSAWAESDRGCVGARGEVGFRWPVVLGCAGDVDDAKARGGMVGGCGADEGAEGFVTGAVAFGCVGGTVDESGAACLPIVVCCATGVRRSGTAFCCGAGAAGNGEVTRWEAVACCEVEVCDESEGVGSAAAAPCGTGTAGDCEDSRVVSPFREAGAVADGETCCWGGTACCAEDSVDDGSGGRPGAFCCAAWVGADGDEGLGAAGLCSEAVESIDGVDDVAPRCRDGMVVARVVVDVGAVPRASLDIEKDVGKLAASAGASLPCPRVDTGAARFGRGAWASAAWHATVGRWGSFERVVFVSSVGSVPRPSSASDGVERESGAAVRGALACGPACAVADGTWPLLASLGVLIASDFREPLERLRPFSPAASFCRSSRAVFRSSEAAAFS